MLQCILRRGTEAVSESAQKDCIMKQFHHCRLLMWWVFLSLRLSLSITFSH